MLQEPGNTRACARLETYLIRHGMLNESIKILIEHIRLESVIMEKFRLETIKMEADHMTRYRLFIFNCSFIFNGSRRPTNYF